MSRAPYLKVTEHERLAVGAQLIAHIEAIIAAGNPALEAEAAQIGRQLIACKELVAHGRWHIFVKDEFGWSDTKAQKYMRTYRMSRVKELARLVEVIGRP